MLLPINVRRHLRSPYTSHSLEEKKEDGRESMLIGKKTKQNNAEIKCKYI